MSEKIPVGAHMEADYLDIGSEEAPRVEFMHYFTLHNESPKARTTEHQYVPDMNTTVLTTSYQTSFPIKLDEYKNDAVSEFIRDVAEEQRLGVACPYYKVRLHQPVDGQENCFYARRFVVGFAIESISREGGGIKAIEGSLNAIGDVRVGSFNTVTRVFTERE